MIKKTITTIVLALPLVVSSQPSRDDIFEDPFSRNTRQVLRAYCAHIEQNTPKAVADEVVGELWRQATGYKPTSMDYKDGSVWIETRNSEVNYHHSGPCHLLETSPWDKIE